MSKWIFIGLVFVLVTTGCQRSAMEAERLAGPAQPSCGYVQNSSGTRVSWKNKTPVKVYISSSWPTHFMATVQRAADQWNYSTGRTLIQIEKNLVGGAPARDGRNVLYWMTSWSPSRKSEQAITTLFYSAGIPHDADIKVDAVYFTFYDDDNPKLGDYHLESLLIHEMGHLLGLAHTDLSPTVMEPYLGPSRQRVDISTNDLKAIKCEYL